MSKPVGGLKFDVAILGGGVAGATVAANLSRSGYSTVIVEQSNYQEVRIGETLPPNIKPLLQRLGTWDRFVSGNCSPSFGIRAAWGQNQLTENDFIHNPYGNGWQVTRNEFDEMLIGFAESSGTHVMRQTILTNFVWDTNCVWKIDVRQNSVHQQLQAKFVIDATGRKSSFAGKLGVRRTKLDHLIGVFGFFARRDNASDQGNFTLIEAVEDGWWYSATVPNSFTIVTLLTDADISANSQSGSGDYWLEQLKRTTHTRKRVGPISGDPDLHAVAANSSRLDEFSGKNWLAVGDAAMAFDPLSGQGIYKALQSAFEATEAIQRHLAGSRTALREYSADAKREFEAYKNKRSAYYSKEKRWLDSLFWQRRIHSNASTTPEAVFT